MKGVSTCSAQCHLLRFWRHLNSYRTKNKVADFGLLQPYEPQRMTSKIDRK